MVEHGPGVDRASVGTQKSLMPYQLLSLWVHHPTGSVVKGRYDDGVSPAAVPPSWLQYRVEGLAQDALDMAMAVRDWNARTASVGWTLARVSR